MLRRVVLAGVPEQVNIPILLAQELGIFAKYGIECDYRVVPEGTGKLLTLLEDGEVDVALTVTDGFIAGKASGRAVKLAGTYVKSPLVWAIATSGANKKQLHSLDSLKSIDEKLRFGVSRIGSGSYTMGIYAANLIDRKKSDLDFVVVNDFVGLRDSVNTDTSDVFMWETFTTKPWFDKKEICKVDEVPTPWPAFSFVTGRNVDEDENNTSRDAYYSHNLGMDIRDKFYPALAEGVDVFMNGGMDTITRIVKEHNHIIEDAQLWISRCEYMTADSNNDTKPFAVDREHYQRSLDIMKQADLVPQDYKVEQLYENSTSVSQVI